MEMKCDSCADWNHQSYLLNGFVQIASIRSGKDLFAEAGCKPFKFCPWCGSILTSDPSAQTQPGDGNG